MIRLSFILILALTIASCHSTKKIQAKPPAIVRDTTTVTITQPVTHAKEDSAAFIREIYHSLVNNKINFTTFSGKIDLDYEDGTGNKFNVNAHVRMYKDSVIWISITAILGIEGLRVLITPDSVRILDKQNKVYRSRSIGFLQEMTSLPLNLSALQDLLIGNPVFLDSNIDAYSKNDQQIVLYKKGPLLNNTLTLGATNRLMQNNRLEDIDTASKRSCYLTYDDYENKKVVNFPQKRTVNVTDKTQLSIKMEYKQYDFNEKLSFPFSVPKNYDLN